MEPILTIPEEMWILFTVLIETIVFFTLKYVPIESGDKPRIVLGLAALAGLGMWPLGGPGLALVVFHAVRSSSNFHDVVKTGLRRQVK